MDIDTDFDWEVTSFFRGSAGLTPASSGRVDPQRSVASEPSPARITSDIVLPSLLPPSSRASPNGSSSSMGVSVTGQTILVRPVSDHSAEGGRHCEPDHELEYAGWDHYRALMAAKIKAKEEMNETKVDRAERAANRESLKRKSSSQVSDDQDRDSEMADAQVQVADDSSLEDTPGPLIMATPDRPYTKWKGLTTWGTLVPEGYRLSTTTPKHPYICPIRTCRKVFEKMNRLGGHFVRQHRGTLLHDNKDGTLSERGRYAGLRDSAPGGRTKPAIVISRGPVDPTEPPMLPPTYRDGDSQQASRQLPQSTWDLVQPFLTNHKGINVPEGGYVKLLLELPRLRDFDWNTEWIDTHPFIDTKPRDISTLIMQLTGDIAPNPCTKCASGRGLFKSCIMLSADAPKLPLANIFCCANCFYHFGQTYCSHKGWGEERSKAIIAGRVTADSESVVARQSSQTNGLHKPAIAITETEPDEQDFVLPPIDDSDEEYVEPSDHAEENDEEMVEIPAGLEMADADRRYDMWPDENVELAPLPGILLPAGYRLNRSDRIRPWVCPVIQCRKAFQRVKDMGFHFKRAHYGECLEDNGDGSFDLVRSYYDKKRGIGPGGKILVDAPAVVVSHKTRKTPIVPNATKTSAAAARHPLGDRAQRLTENMDLLTVEDIATETVEQALARAPHREEKEARKRIRDAIRREEEAAERALKRPRTFVGTETRSTVIETRSTRASISTSMAVAPRPEQLQQAQQPRQAQQSSPLMIRGTFEPPQPILEMEEWEMAPGRIMSSDGTHNVALSSPFLQTSFTSSDSIPILRGVSSKVCSIHPGQSIVFESDMSKTVQFWVSSGKVRVKLGEEQEFVIGPHGCVVVKPGMQCEVRNGIYVEAWILVSEFGREYF